MISNHVPVYLFGCAPYLLCRLGRNKQLLLLLLLHSLGKRLQVVPRKLTLPNDAVLRRPCRHDGFQVPRIPRIHSLSLGTVDPRLLSHDHETKTSLHSERRGGIATAPPLRRSYSDRAVTSPGGAFQTDTNLANHRHRTRLLADCQ